MSLVHRIVQSGFLANDPPRFLLLTLELKGLSLIHVRNEESVFYLHTYKVHLNVRPTY